MIWPWIEPRSATKYGNLYLSGAVELTNEIENTIVEDKLTKDETGDVVLV